MSKDAKFLVNLQKVFEDDETSLKFKPHLSKMKSAFYEASVVQKKKKKESLKLSLINNEMQANPENESNFLKLL